MKILQIGLGGFGKNHLKAWHEMGLGANLHIAELNQAQHKEVQMFNMPAERVGTDIRKFLDRVDIVDIVTPSTNHFELCRMALEAGKHVFVEKPMTMNSEEAKGLEDAVRKSGKVLQVGYYYRFHPISLWLHEELAKKSFGAIRHLSGHFMGFKRARTDVGVTHTDGIHFLDLLNWLVGSPPDEVYAVVKDHFGRGLEDFSTVILKYPGNTTATVESGYIQPGRWRDKVVPNAFTSKDFYLCGTRKTAEVDFETENLGLTDVQHEFNGTTWAPVIKNNTVLNVGTATPVQMIMGELKAFLTSIQERTPVGPNVTASGVVLARQMEAIYESARQGRPVPLSWSANEKTI